MNISLSCVNGQTAKAPYDFTAPIKPLLAYPASLRRNIWSWNPDVQNSPPEGGMIFDQGDRARVQAAQSLCAANGAQWCAYIGGDYGVYPDNKSRRAVLERFRGCPWLGLDHTDTGTLSGALVQQACNIGFSVVLEANLDRQPWIRDMARRFPGRVAMMAESWLWLASEPAGLNGVLRPGRFTIREAQEAGMQTFALVTRRISGNDPRLGFTNIKDADWPAYKATVCEMMAARGVDHTILRPAGMQPAALAKVEAIANA